jgi:hypothetical protein
VTDVALSGNALRDKIQRTQSTADLIAQEGRSITLHRGAALVPDGAGGWVPGSGSDTIVDQQNLFFTASLYEPLELATSATGEALHEKFILIGMPDADIQEGDWLEFSNHKYVVNFIHADRSYQVKAEGEAVSEGG